MNEFDKIKNYFINIDFSIVNDSEVLDNVYKEIQGWEERLILNIESVTNFEILVQKSNIHQLVNLCKSLNIHFLSLKKTGSKFLEVLYTTIYEMKDIPLSKFEKSKNVIQLKLDEQKDISQSLLYKNVFLPIIENFLEICIDKNGTHVIRKFLKCFYRKNLAIEKNFKSEISQILQNDIPIDTLITIVQYLKLQYSKSIVRMIIKKIFKSEFIFNKLYTYIFEDIINIADQKSLEMIFSIVKPQFRDYSDDKYSVFVILALIKKLPSQNDFYFSKCEAEMKNPNILLKVTENYCILKKIDKLEEILKKFYGLNSDIFEGLLLKNTESPDTKYVNLVVLLMEEDLFKVNIDFTKLYKPEWAHKKFGISLLLGFLKGGASKNLKASFAKNFTISHSLNKKKEGKKIISLIKSYKRINFN